MTCHNLQREALRPDQEAHSPYYATPLSPDRLAVRTSITAAISSCNTAAQRVPAPPPPLPSLSPPKTRDWLKQNDPP